MAERLRQPHYSSDVVSSPPGWGVLMRSGQVDIFMLNHLYNNSCKMKKGVSLQKDLHTEKEVCWENIHSELVGLYGLFRDLSANPPPQSNLLYQSINFVGGCIDKTLRCLS